MTDISFLSYNNNNNNRQCVHNPCPAIHMVIFLLICPIFNAKRLGRTINHNEENNALKRKKYACYCLIVIYYSLFTNFQTKNTLFCNLYIAKHTFL